MPKRAGSLLAWSVRFLAVGILATACTTSESSNGDGAVQAVERFDPSSPESIDRLNDIVAEGADVIPSLEPLLTASDPIRRWAALYVIALLADSEEDADVLVPILDDPDPASRVIAAGSLVGLGREEAIPVLIEGLATDAMLPYMDPPGPVSDLAREALGAYTGETFATVEEWGTWWDDVGDRIRWDGERYVVG